MAENGKYIWPSHDFPVSKKKPATRTVATQSPPPAPKLAAHAAVSSQPHGMHKENTSVPAASAPPLETVDAAPGASQKKPVIASLAKLPPKPDCQRLRGSLSEQVATCNILEK